MPKQLTPEKALDRAQWLCSQSEKCISDIKLKLTQWGIEPNEKQRIIDSLIADGFINEDRFAQTYARDKARFSKWGPRKIEIALRAKRINTETIEKALSCIQNIMSSDNLFEILSKKAKTVRYKDVYDLKSKLLRFGVSRGFDYGEVLNATEKIITHK
ncbi:MAG TPA: RecX family transcriptional regulator [Bacteroidetes bacterium]|nr:RecX family transcriptional regulator [Bacteroidota bacterium]